MKAPLFSDILQISQNIAEASNQDNDVERAEQYQALIKLCAANENSPKDHPLQWEALADFTNDSEQAIDIYEKGLACAEKLKLVDYRASIYLAMAQRYEEMEELDKALEFANHANELIDEVENEELITDITHYLANLPTSN